MMKMFVTISLLVLFGCVSGANAISKPDPEDTQGQTAIGKRYIFTGLVEKVDVKANLVIVKGAMMQEKKTLTFDVNDKTRIWRGKMMLHISDLDRTLQVRVEYKQEMDRLTALTIEVTDR